MTAAPTPEQPEPGVHFVTTAPTLKLLNHHPLLEEFLQEGLEKGELRPDPPTASPLPRLANQDSRPVFTSPTPVVAAAPTQPQSREGPWSLESESPALRITAALPPGPSMAMPTPGPGEGPNTTPPGGAWTPAPEGPGDIGMPWAPGIMFQTTELGMEGTVTTSTASGDDEETATSTIVTTTVTTVQPPGQLLAGSNPHLERGMGELGALWIPLSVSLCWPALPTHREHADCNQTQIQILTESNYPRPWGFPGGASGKEPTCQGKRRKRRRLDPSVGKMPLEEGTATHSSILAWRTPWTEEPGGLQSLGSQRVGHD